MFRDCQVVLEDVFENGQAAKHKALNGCPDKTHSAPSHHPFDNSYLESVSDKSEIAWPKMRTCDADTWAEYDGAVYSRLVGASSIFERVNLLETTMYSQALQIFGLMPLRSKGLKGLNRRALRSIELVKEKNQLNCQIEACIDLEQKSALELLLQDVRTRLRAIRKGENSRKKRWRRRQAMKSFFKNPYQAGKDVLDPKCYNALSVEQDILDSFKASSVSDPLRDEPLPHLDGLPANPEISVPFDVSLLKFDDFLSLLYSRRNGSKAGVNMLPYKAFKKCPQTASYLFKIYRSCVKLHVVPVQWRIMSEIYIPKSKHPDCNQVADFRSIALLNVEGKLFFSLISKRIQSHIVTKNNFIDRSIQKGCMEKVPGCWEHMSSVWQELCDNVM